ncbi:MAG: [FeFe] hydrogenase H-cluster radical SAM maturase HydE [Eubacterium sp.]|nr:[FeFe] hydrogenase H-cluster radical SAM maturase HydE [Eubacterium sp.]
MYKELIDRLERENILTRDEYLTLIKNRSKITEYAAKRALETRRKYYGNKVYIRGLIEISSYCRNNCYYCGIRADNKNAERYRLSAVDILDCAAEGYRLGFRTIVLQGGEDGFYDSAFISAIIKLLKHRYPDIAITLSLGEMSFNDYKRMKKAGADRYLLRHETCDRAHYGKLHPAEMSFDNRQRCIADLKALGYQTGVGFMVGSPFQTEENLADELIYLKELQPEMVGIGPFISHRDTPFSKYESGSAELTVFMLSLIRLTLPRVLLPATTALATVDPFGREKGLKAGANVVMPNLSPVDVREKYMLYDNKACTGEEAAQCLNCLKQRVKNAGFEITTDRGDYNNEI